MECPSCRAEVPAGARFCDQCGAALPSRCPSCGHANAPGAKFCSDCGGRLIAAAVPGTPPPDPATIPAPATAASSAERRQLTVMFCDLVGSTALALRLDPEDLREVMGAYRRRVAEVVGRFDGFVAKYMGDGVLVYFGYPAAHEDDAERAVRAGLALVGAFGQLAAAERLQVRLGIATGVVIVGDLVGSGEAQERGVVGKTPNLAARLQGLAKPDSVVIAASTHELTGGLFEYEDLGAVEVKGFAEPVRAWRVRGESAVESRYEALRRGSAEAPLVGRNPELALLLERWSRAMEGEGQVILLEGEPGIGKSRLVRALRERMVEAYTPLSHYCSPYHTNSALHPVIVHLERAARFEREDTAETKRAKLEALLAPSARDVRAAAALLAPLLAIPADGRYPPLDLTPRRQKERTFDVLVEQLVGLAGRRPVVTIYEDVHWADPSTLDLLGRLIEQVQRLPALALITFRPEFSPPWTGQAHVTRLSLSRLTQRHAAAIARRVTGGRPLPAEVVEQIVARTDGVPLFVEELTRAVLEAGAGDAAAGLNASAAPLAIPTTLHASLMARLDRLGSVAKEVAQTGAAIGREFSHELLAAVSPRRESEWRAALELLVGSGLVFQRGAPPQASYLFKHALVQDAAYHTLLRGARQDLHARIAGILESRFPESVETEPALLARHCAEAGLIEKAVTCFGRAGKQAIARSAMTEAVAMLRKALSLLAGLPDNPARWRQELALQSALGVALIAVKGYSADETGEVYRRARAICDRLGDMRALTRIASGQVYFHLLRADLSAARRTAEDFLHAVETAGAPEAQPTAHQLMGMCLFHQGRLAAARSHLDIVAAAPDGAGGRRESVSVASYLALALCLQGRYGEAWAQSAFAIAEARRSRRLHRLAFAVGMRGWLHQLLRKDYPELTEEVALLAKEQGFPYWRAVAILQRAGAAARRGENAEAATLFAKGARDHRAIGAASLMPWWTALVAPALDPAEAEPLLDEQLRQTEATDERWCEAEIHRVRGELARRRGDLGTAEAHLIAALEIARRQEARHWELRAAVDLARLRRDQGKQAEARALLAPVHAWFPEPLDTPDLEDAKTLLDELRQ